ncbi:hypothetical protein N0V83_007707, partial [Neocucurbitaria cava]
MADFEHLIQDAVATHDIPGCALVSTNRDGTFHYAKAFGSTSMKEANASPFALNTIMWIASCTKLMTSLCCMQLVERRLITLDEPVYTHIPELRSFNVLKGFEEDSGKPIEEPHRKDITLRLLLTHASGLAYDGMSASSLAWLKWHGREPSTSGKLLERFNGPLMFEPGESWAYGPGIDYAGLLVERVTGKSLEEYMRENLWERLGVRDITFFPSSRPDLKGKMADMSVRDESGKVRFTGARMSYQDAEGKEASDCMGGQGTFTSAEEYVKVLKAVLTCDEDEKILTKGSIEEFFRPQLGQGSKRTLNEFLQDDM